jgi:hypothetical protein
MVAIALDLTETLQRIEQLGERWLEALVARRYVDCTRLSAEIDAAQAERRRLERRLRR